MVLEEYLELENSVEFDDAYEYSSVYGFVEPGISVAYSYRFMTMALKLGYFLQYYSSSLKEEEYGFTFWASNYNTNARANWSGVRIGLTLSVRWARDKRAKSPRTACLHTSLSRCQIHFSPWYC